MLTTELNIREQALIRNLDYVGERVVKEAREAGSYKNRTGNLRASTGYIIVRHGAIIIQSAFSPENGSEQGENGMPTGSEFAHSLVPKYPAGIVLIVVAGMKYAAAVTAKGYNVLDSSELLAQKLVTNLVKKLSK